MKVFVYFNLHRKVWSVKALQGPQAGRVIMHTQNVVLAFAEFRVSETGRQRVIREKRKNVHAGVVGELIEGAGPRAVRISECIAKAGIRVGYNPYEGPNFTERETDKRLPVRSAYRVALDGRNVYAEEAA